MFYEYSNWITYRPTKTHSTLRGKKTDTPNKYLLTPPVMSSQQLCVLHRMDNSLASKNYFPQFAFQKLLFCGSHVSVD